MPSMIGEIGEHHLDRLVDDAQPRAGSIDDAFVADDLLTANVRISRFVQNGMVIRNSHMSRQRRSGRDEIGRGKTKNAGTAPW